MTAHPRQSPQGTCPVAGDPCIWVTCCSDALKRWGPKLPRPPVAHNLQVSVGPEPAFQHLPQAIGVHAVCTLLPKQAGTAELGQGKHTPTRPSLRLCTGPVTPLGAWQKTDFPGTKARNLSGRLSAASAAPGFGTGPSLGQRATPMGTGVCTTLTVAPPHPSPPFMHLSGQPNCTQSLPLTYLPTVPP